MTVRTRFSPSPTGMIHLGNARTALFSALYAAKENGAFILRIEDSDITRSEERFVDMLQTDLKWLQINWQEGPGVDGDFGPYWQSQRQAIYLQFYERMEAEQLIYPCFCTDQELLLSRKSQLARGEPPRYSGVCRKLSASEVANRIQQGKKPAWRFIVPNDQVIKFNDLVKGEQEFQTNMIGDFIIRRADGTPPFLFCNAIDDATMNVTHVIRGEDHLANTPRQIMLLNALDQKVPQYGHLSLIVGQDGAPLSKRHGSFALHELQKQGFLPLAIINYLARLGHRVDASELMNFVQLAHEFYIERLSRSPARFDETQLLYWQKNAVQNLTNAEFWQWVGESVQQQVPENKREIFAETIKANFEFPKDAAQWAQILFADQMEIAEPQQKLLQAAGEQFFVEAELAVDKFAIDLPAILQEMKTVLQLSGKKLFLPFRIALTGQDFGPELLQIAKLMGAKRMKQRLTAAFKLASKK